MPRHHRRPLGCSPFRAKPTLLRKRLAAAATRFLASHPEIPNKDVANRPSCSGCSTGAPTTKIRKSEPPPNPEPSGFPANSFVLVFLLALYRGFSAALLPLPYR